MQFRTSAITFFALLGLMLISSASSYAQGNKTAAPAATKPAVVAVANTKPTATVATTVVAPKPETPPSPFSIMLSASRTRSLNNFKDGSLSESNDYEFLPSYKWAYGKTSLYFTFSEDLRAEEDASDFNDIAWINSFKGWELSKIKLSPSVTVTIPQSKESREIKNLETAMSAKMTASIKEEYLIPGLSLAASVSAGRSFHRYNTALTGEVNNQYSSRQVLMGGYAVGIFSFDAEFHHINAWTYNGVLKESFEHAEEMSVSIGDHFGFTLGHTNAGSVFKVDGYTSNYKLIDENNSLVYAKVSMQY
ncbi:hypothetical protein [Bdellovibrio sp. HCB337]|uniref:hypothetical protein n=1 Tax=Bdellovibrio sp. HCB337 TaxID=3394358 RepID=UPI0039A49139